MIVHSLAGIIIYYILISMPYFDRRFRQYIISLLHSLITISSHLMYDQSMPISETNESAELFAMKVHLIYFIIDTFEEIISTKLDLCITSYI